MNRDDLHDTIADIVADDVSDSAFSKVADDIIGGMKPRWLPRLVLRRQHGA